MDLIGVRADTNGFWQRSVKSANPLNNQLLCNIFFYLAVKNIKERQKDNRLICLEDGASDVLLI